MLHNVFVCRVQAIKGSKINQWRPLPESVYTPIALVEPIGIVREIGMYDHRGGTLQVQSFRNHVSCKQHCTLGRGKLIETLVALSVREVTVKSYDFKIGTS